MSRNRATKRTITSLSETNATVPVVESASEAATHLEENAIDALVIHAGSVDVPAVIDTLERTHPNVPAFIHWEGSELRALGEETTLEAALAGRTGRRELDALIDAVKLRLFDSTSPGTIDHLVREIVVDDGRFAFTWIGEYDRGEREIVPWVTETPEAWSINRTFAIGTGETPMLERALRDQELQVVEDVQTNRSAVPLGDDAVRNDVRAVAAVPLSSPESVYGLLVVYATAELGTAERDAIREIGTVISRVLEFIAVRGRLPQLERELHRYERLVETAGDGMYVLDEESHFTTVNTALVEMTGYSREGLLGEPVSLLFDDEDVEAWTETIRQLLANGGTTDTVEMMLVPKSGDPIPCETQLALLERNETFVGTVGVLRDVTERKRREEKLQEQNERLDAFTRIVSHDLRNPLSVSKGYLDLVAEQADPNPEYLEHVRDSVERMETIVDDVLSIAREGEWASDVEPVEISQTAETAWEHVTTPNASLSIDTTEQCRIEADRSRLLRLFENLFRNAIEHGSATTVEVGVLGSADDPEGFSVEDDGSGLPDDLRGRIFDPAVSTSSDGLGIGLWIVREVATGHGWSVTATEGTDGGARFEFEF